MKYESDNIIYLSDLKNPNVKYMEQSQLFMNFLCENGFVLLFTNIKVHTSEKEQYSLEYCCI